MPAEAVLPDLFDLLLRLLLLNDHLHFIRSEHFDTDEDRRTLFGLEDCGFLGRDVEHALVAS